jgi:hypothetical protein
MSNNKQKTVLILAANPKSTLRLRLDEEVREIENGLQAAKHREQFKLVHKWAVRSRDFYRAILEHQPQIVHFWGASQFGTLPLRIEFWGYTNQVRLRGLMHSLHSFALFV